LAKLDILIRADNQASGPIGAVKKALDGLGGAAKASVAAAGMAAAASVTAVVGAIGVGVGKAAELEQGVADIASVMGITFDEAQPLGELISNLGMDPKLKVNAVEASDAIMQLAQSGISMTDILDGAARSTVLLSNATGGDMATSAAVASDAMALFGIDAKDMQDAVNGITGVTVASKFGIQDYQFALAAAGGVASAVGVDFDDFNATIAAISPYFASGSDAGTSFKTFLQRLVPQSNEAESAMRALGLVTEDGTNQFFDANGQMKSMEEIAGLLADATKGMSEEQMNSAYSIIFGSDAMRAAFGISKQGAEGFRDVAGALGEIDAEASAATRMNTFGAQMEILQGVIDGLLTQIGQAFLPILRELANWATEYVSNNGEELVGWFESLAGWLKDVTPVALEWGKTLAGALGELTAWLTGQKTDFGDLNKLWTALQGAVETAVGAVVKFIQDNLPSWLEALRQWGLAAWQWIVDAMPLAAEKLTQLTSGLLRWVVESLPGWAAALAGWAAAAWQWVVDAIPQVMAKLGELWDKHIKPWLDEKTGGLGTIMGEWGGQFGGFVDGVLAGWRETWPEVSGILTSAADDITEDVGRIITSLQSIFDMMSEGGGASSQYVVNWAQLWTTIVDVIAGAETYMIDSAANVVQAIALIGEALQKAGGGDWSGLGDVVGRFNQMGLDIAQGNLDRMEWIQDLFSREILTPRALGGPVAAGGRYWVGEREPELFVPDEDGTIVPSSNMTTYNTWNVNLSGGGGAGNDVLSAVGLLQALYG
jgi:TP901 family phage tail tape measure protein